MRLTQALGALSQQFEWGFVELMLADVVSTGLPLIQDDEWFGLADCIAAKTQSGIHGQGAAQNDHACGFVNQVIASFYRAAWHSSTKKNNFGHQRTATVLTMG